MTRSDNFHILRLVFASMVLLAHSHEVIGYRAPQLLGRGLGALGVHCFFILSGYLIATSYLNSASPSQFVLKRCLRIVPALIVAFLLGRLLWRHFDHYSGNALPYVHAGLWTLVYEGIMYGLVVIIGMAGLLTRQGIGAFYAGGLVLMFISLDGISMTATVLGTIFLMFLSGAYIRVTEPEHDLRPLSILCIALLCVLYVPISWTAVQGFFRHGFYLYAPNLSLELLRWFVTSLALPFALIFFAIHMPAHLSFPMRNDYSYGVYIFGWPIQQSLAHVFPNSFQPLTMFIASFAIAGLVAYISWHLLEKHAIALPKKLSLAILWVQANRGKQSEYANAKIVEPSISE